VQLLPHALVLPFGLTSLVGHAAVAAHFLRQQLSPGAGAEDEENTCEARAIRHTFAPRMLEPAWLLRNDRFNEVSQSVLQQRLGHIVPSCTTNSPQDAYRSNKVLSTE